MKWIKFKLGRGVVHIAKTDEMFEYSTSCSGNWPRNSAGDILSYSYPIGRLCPKCKKKYLKDHDEDDLLLEMI